LTGSGSQATTHSDQFPNPVGTHATRCDPVPHGFGVGQLSEQLESATTPIWIQTLQGGENHEPNVHGTWPNVKAGSAFVPFATRNKGAEKLLVNRIITHS